MSTWLYGSGIVKWQDMRMLYAIFEHKTHARYLIYSTMTENKPDCLHDMLNAQRPIHAKIAKKKHHRYHRRSYPSL